MGCYVMMWLCDLVNWKMMRCELQKTHVTARPLRRKFRCACDPGMINRNKPGKPTSQLRTTRSFSVFQTFQSLASVTHGHSTQALYWRCAKQKDRAKIFHCFKLENKASSRSAPPTTSVASLYTLDPQEFFGRPRRCGCSAIRG